MHDVSGSAMAFSLGRVPLQANLVLDQNDEAARAYRRHAYTAYQAAASAGSAVGMFYVGWCLVEGVGCRQDRVAAVMALACALNGGESRALEMLQGIANRHAGPDGNEARACAAIEVAQAQGPCDVHGHAAKVKYLKVAMLCFMCVCGVRMRSCAHLVCMLVCPPAVGRKDWHPQTGERGGGVAVATL